MGKQVDISVYDGRGKDGGWVRNTQYPHFQDLSSLKSEPGEGVLFFSRARILKPFKEPRSQFPAWRASTTTLFDVYLPARQATYRLAESIPVLFERLQIRV